MEWNSTLCTVSGHLVFNGFLPFNIYTLEKKILRNISKFFSLTDPSQIFNTFTPEFVSHDFVNTWQELSVSRMMHIKGEQNITEWHIKAFTKTFIHFFGQGKKCLFSLNIQSDNLFSRHKFFLIIRFQSLFFSEKMEIISLKYAKQAVYIMLKEFVISLAFLLKKLFYLLSFNVFKN